jgi:hypothetical protein
MSAPDLGGLKLSVRDGQVAITRAYFANRRGDRLACEAHLIQAQQAVTTADREINELERGGRHAANV